MFEVQFMAFYSESFHIDTDISIGMGIILILVLSIRQVLQDETDSIAETEADREMKRERENEGDREGGAINLTSRYLQNKQTKVNKHTNKK